MEALGTFFLFFWGEGGGLFFLFGGAQLLSGSLFLGGCPTKNGLPKKGFPFVARVTEQLRGGKQPRGTSFRGGGLATPGHEPPKGQGDVSHERSEGKKSEGKKSEGKKHV